jgi:hypothetical protein
LHTSIVEKTAHLGLTSADLALLVPDSKSSTLEPAEPTRAFDDPVATIAPDDGKTLSSSSSPSTTSGVTARVRVQNRLDKLVSHALTPLEQIGLDGLITPHLFFSSSDEPNQDEAGNTSSTAEIIALSLLSLAIAPENLPAPFLLASIHKQFPSLVSKVQDLTREAFGGDVSAEDALVKAALVADEDGDNEDDEGAYEGAIEGYQNLDVGSGKVELPWRRAKPRGVTSLVGGLLGRGVAGIRETVGL